MLQLPEIQKHTRMGRAETILARVVFSLLPFLIAPVFAHARQMPSSAHKSIHQIEWEAHRDLVMHPASEAARALLLPQAIPANRSRTVFGFYPYWAPGFSELRFQDLTHLAVFSVEANGSGQLTNLRGWPNVPLIQAAHGAHVRVVLVCTLFSAAELDALLSTPAARQALIENLVQQVILGGADGINIDFEGVRGPQRENLILFMTELATQLRAAVPGAHLSIDTPAIDWLGAFDYAALAGICDALMIMAYDYYWSGSAYAGPVSPLVVTALWGPYSVQWTVLDYLAKVGEHRSSKLLLGVPYYCYEWPVAASVLRAPALDKAVARTYSDASNRAAMFGRNWDTFSATPWYAEIAQTVRQGWYENAESLSLKYDLVFQYGLQGIGIWALTYDRGKSELWDLIEQRFPPEILPDPPEITAPATFFDSVGLPIALRAQGSTPVAGYEIAIGTSPGGTDISGYQAVGLRSQILLQGLGLTPGVVYYITARSVGPQGLAGPAGPSTAVVIDPARPVKRKYLAHWSNSGDLYTGLAILNAAAGPQAVLMRGYLAGQADPIVSSWVLKPGQQLAQLLEEEDVLGAASGGNEGWLEVSYQGDSLKSMYLVGDTRIARSLDGGALIDADRSLILPFPDGGNAVIALANPNPAAAAVSLHLHTAGGLHTASLSLPGKTAVTKRAADLFPTAFAPWLSAHADSGGIGDAAYIGVESDRPIACSATLERNHDSAIVPALYRLQALGGAALSYVLWGGGYETEAVLVNPSAGSVSVELRLLGPAAADPVRFALAPESAAVLKLSEVFGIRAGNLVTGSVWITASGGTGILGSAWLRTTDYRSMAALPLEVPGTHVQFPQVAQGQGFWTGLSITNVGTAANHVSLEALDAEGRSLGTYEADLGPGEQRVSLLYQWIRATIGVMAGRIEIRSSAPLLATEIFGSDNLSFMTAVPGK